MTLRAIWLPVQVVDALTVGAYVARPTWEQTSWQVVALSVTSYALAALTLALAVAGVLP